jgi:hypothetical protein
MIDCGNTVWLSGTVDAAVITTANIAIIYGCISTPDSSTVGCTHSNKVISADITVIPNSVAIGYSAAVHARRAVSTTDSTVVVGLATVGFTIAPNVKVHVFDPCLKLHDLDLLRWQCSVRILPNSWGTATTAATSFVVT